MVVGVRGGVLRVQGRRAGPVAGVLRVNVDVWVALVSIGRAGRCRVALWVRGGLWGGLAVSWMPVDGDGAVRVGREVGQWTSVSCTAL